MSSWKITYTGEGIAQIDGVGNFQKHTTASVTEEVAARLKGQANWLVVGPGDAAPAAKVAPAPAKAEPKAPDAKAPDAKADDKKAADAKADDKKAPDAKADDKAAKKADEKKPDAPAGK